MTNYISNKPGPFTASKGDVSVTRDTLDECAKAYAEIATAENLGMGQIYRADDIEGKVHFINAQGVIDAGEAAA